MESKLRGNFFQILCACQKVGTLQAPVILHFKGLVFRNLEYEIRIWQKIHTKVIITMSMLSRFFLNQRLGSHFLTQLIVNI